MYQMADGMVVVGYKRIWNRDAVVPCLVPVSQRAAIGRVQEVRVDIVLDDLESRYFPERSKAMF